MPRVKVKRVLAALGLSAAAMTLALVAAAFMPDSVWPVVVGVLAGIAASLPTSLVIVWRVNRAQAQRTPAPAASAERPPTVVVVPPVPAPAAAPGTARPPSPPAPGLVRESRPAAIIGGRDEASA